MDTLFARAIILIGQHHGDPKLVLFLNSSRTAYSSGSVVSPYIMGSESLIGILESVIARCHEGRQGRLY